MSSHLPKVSLGVPVYNGERYLGEALESLLAQSFEDFELVISDNASTDGTEEICQQYAARDGRIRYFRQSENTGAAANFNRVFELSRCRFFTWAASDDVRSPSFLEKCIEVLDNEPDVHWCHTKSSHIGPDGKLLENPMLKDVSYVEGPWIGQDAATAIAPLATRAAHRPHHRLQGVLLGHGGCIDSYGLMRSETVRKTQLILPYFGAEKVFVAELALAGRYHEVPETLFFLRIHDAAAGALTTAAEQQAYFAPRAVGSSTRLKLLAAYVAAIGRADLSIVDRARCSTVLLKYLLQFGKWGNVLRKALSGAGVGGRNLTMLDKREDDDEKEANKHS